MSLRIKIDKLRQIVAYFSEFSEEVSINVDSNSNLMYIFAALGGSVNIWAIIPLSASVFMMVKTTKYLIFQYQK